MRHFKLPFPQITFTLLLLSISMLAADKKQSPAAPVPAQILSAKKIFIANAGGDESVFEEGSQYTGGTTRAYNQLYDAMKTWAHFELVSSPAEADLLVEIEFINNLVQPNQNGLFSPQSDPRLHLTIRDPKTNAILWGISEHAQWAILQGNRDRNFDTAMSKIVGEVRRISVPADAPAASAR